jgi:hypothetical protein
MRWVWNGHDDDYDMIPFSFEQSGGRRTMSSLGSNLFGVLTRRMWKSSRHANSSTCAQPSKSPTIQIHIIISANESSIVHCIGLVDDVDYISKTRVPSNGWHEARAWCGESYERHSHHTTARHHNHIVPPPPTRQTTPRTLISRATIHVIHCDNGLTNPPPGVPRVRQSSRRHPQLPNKCCAERASRSNGTGPEACWRFQRRVSTTTL